MVKFRVGLIMFIVVVTGFALPSAGKVLGRGRVYKEKTTIVSSGAFFPDYYFIHGKNGYDVIKRGNLSFSFFSFIITSDNLDYFAKIRLDLTWK